MSYGSIPLALKSPQLPGTLTQKIDRSKANPFEKIPLNSLDETFKFFPNWQQLFQKLLQGQISRDDTKSDGTLSFLAIHGTYYLGAIEINKTPDLLAQYNALPREFIYRTEDNKLRARYAWRAVLILATGLKLIKVSNLIDIIQEWNKLLPKMTGISLPNYSYVNNALFFKDILNLYLIRNQSIILTSSALTVEQRNWFSDSEECEAMCLEELERCHLLYPTDKKSVRDWLDELIPRNSAVLKIQPATNFLQQPALPHSFSAPTAALRTPENSPNEFETLGSTTTDPRAPLLPRETSQTCCFCGCFTWLCRHR